jgi:hypothetical protein
MLITIDTEDPALNELLVQFLSDRVKQRMLHMYSAGRVVRVPSKDGLTTQEGLFIQDGDVEIAKRVASNHISVLGTGKTFIELMAKKLIETLLSFAMIDKRILTASEVADYANSLVTWIGAVLKDQDAQSIEAIRDLWDGESWESIQAKLMTEASTWHVWWMDGLRKYISIDRGWITKEEPGIRIEE